MKRCLGPTRALTFAFLMSLALIVVPVTSLADVVEDAPEASEYSLLYEMEIPDSAGLNLFGAQYAVDNTATFNSGFDRVAYHLELQKPGEERFFVYVSLPALVLLPQETGVPTTVSGVEIQQVVDDVHVVSNHPELLGLDSPLEASVEFWPYNYTTGNAIGVPGATGELYDSGDTPAGNGDYGSMQIHVAGTNQTLFAFNNWGGGFGSVDVGIGNAPPSASEHPDWTFATNGDQYELKTLRILARPGAPATGLSATITEPEPQQVIQRQDDNTGSFNISGVLKIPGDQVDGRLIAISPEGEPELEGPWEMVDEGPLGTTFSGSLKGAGGWYRMELRLWKEGLPIDVMVIEPVGIGEVFITSGQSNSANSGEVLLSPSDPRVSAWGLGGWQMAHDPQPIATGGGGTPWPALGDLLVERFEVPVGFISVGWGGTRVDQWLPFATDGLYDRFLIALEEVGTGGARAILWHQGESDAFQGTPAETYQERLETIIASTRGDGGWSVPWGVARASFLPGLAQEALDAVVAGQNATIDADPLTFAGPSTDDMIGPEWRYDEVHFNEAGLIEHAKRWNDTIELPSCMGLIPNEDCPEDEPDVVEEEDGNQDDPADTTEGADALEDAEVPEDSNDTVDASEESGEVTGEEESRETNADARLEKGDGKGDPSGSENGDADTLGETDTSPQNQEHIHGIHWPLDEPPEESSLTGSSDRGCSQREGHSPIPLLVFVLLMVGTLRRQRPYSV